MKINLFVLVAIAFAVAGALTARQWMDSTTELRAASVFPEARLIEPFELSTARGEPFTEADLKGRWSLILFGFTNCPDICPDTLSQLASAMQSLELMRRETLPQVIFVSVDPERDRGETLEDYVTWFNPDFRAVTADDDRLRQLTGQLSVVYYRDEADPDSGAYTVDHSGMVIIVDPEGRFYGRFAQPFDTDDLVADLFQLTS